MATKIDFCKNPIIQTKSSLEEKPSVNCIISPATNFFAQFATGIFLQKQFIPNEHCKCRYDPNDSRCLIKLFTRTKDVERFPVPRDKISWKITYNEYDPINFTSDKIKNKNIGDYKDPDSTDFEYTKLRFNEEQKLSHLGPYEVKYNGKVNAHVPHNPIGRTGIVGRGHLGKWGPNHAADPIVTRWKRDENGNKVINSKTGKQILQFVAIQRRDTKEWAIPGGMIEPKEFVETTLAREFAEEALSKEFKQISKVVNHKIYTTIAENNTFDKKYNEFFLKGTEIYKGIVDDPRNTDNAWMETIVYNFHDENNEFVGELNLKSGSDAEGVQWLDIDSSLVLFASHSYFLRQVADRHRAHW